MTVNKNVVTVLGNVKDSMKIVNCDLHHQQDISIGDVYHFLASNLTKGWGQ